MKENNLTQTSSALPGTPTVLPLTASGSAQSGSIHQTGSGIESRETTRYAAKVGDTCYASLSEAVDAYHAANGPNDPILTLMADSTGDMELTGEGVVDLNGFTVNGTITTKEAAGQIITIKGGLVRTASNHTSPIIHNGKGEMRLTSLMVEAAMECSGVYNMRGTLTMDNTVAVKSPIYVVGDGLNLNGGGPTIITSNSYQFFLNTSITLDSPLKNIFPYTFNIASPDSPVTTNWPEGSGDPDDHFKDINGLHFSLEGGKVVAHA